MSGLQIGARGIGVYTQGMYWLYAFMFKRRTGQPAGWKHGRIPGSRGSGCGQAPARNGNGPGAFDSSPPALVAFGGAQFQLLVTW